MFDFIVWVSIALVLGFLSGLGFGLYLTRYDSRNTLKSYESEIDRLNGIIRTLSSLNPVTMNDGKLKYPGEM